MDDKAIAAARWVRLAAGRQTGELTAPDFEDHPGPTTKTVARRHGSWNDAKRAAGLEPTEKRGIPLEDVARDLRRVADELGRAPTYQEYNELGEYSTGPARRRLGEEGWNGAIKAAGLEPNKRFDMDDEEVLEDLRNVASELGRCPSISEYREHGVFSRDRVISITGAWSSSCQTAGLNPVKCTRNNADPRLQDPDILIKMYKKDEKTVAEIAEELNCTTAAISYKLDRAGVETRPRGVTAVWSDALSRMVASKTERAFAAALSRNGILDDAKYQPASVRAHETRWEPDFKVNEWLVECKQGSWGNVYSQAEVMETTEMPVFVYGLKRDIEALPHQASKIRVPGEVPRLSNTPLLD